MVKDMTPFSHYRAHTAYALITYSNALVLDYLTETIQLTLVFRLGSKRDTNRNEACEHHHVVG